MSFSTVTWANKDVPELAKFQQMQANTDHVLTELAAVNVLTLGYLQYVPRFSTSYAFGFKVDSTVAGTLASVTTTPTDYAILNGNISAVAVGQHTLYFNNLVGKLWKPDGLNYLSAWFRANSNLTGGLFVDWVSVMIHRAPL